VTTAWTSGFAVQLAALVDAGQAENVSTRVVAAEQVRVPVGTGACAPE